MLPGMDGPSASKSPLELMGAIGMTNSELRPGLRLVEVYTMQRMLKLLWFGNPAASEVVVMMAGYGDFRIIEGAGHGLENARDELITLLDEWIDERFAGTPLDSVGTG